MKLTIVQAQIIRDLMNAPDAVHTMFLDDINSCIDLGELKEKAVQATHLMMMVNELIPHDDEYGKITVDPLVIATDVVNDHLSEVSDLIKKYHPR